MALMSLGARIPEVRELPEAGLKPLDSGQLEVLRLSFGLLVWSPARAGGGSKLQRSQVLEKLTVSGFLTGLAACRYSLQRLCIITYWFLEFLPSVQISEPSVAA